MIGPARLPETWRKNLPHLQSFVSLWVVSGVPFLNPIPRGPAEPLPAPPGGVVKREDPVPFAVSTVSATPSQYLDAAAVVGCVPQPLSPSCLIVVIAHTW